MKKSVFLSWVFVSGCLIAQTSINSLDQKINNVLNQSLADSVKTELICDVIAAKNIPMNELLNLSDKYLAEGKPRKACLLASSLTKYFSASWQTWQQAGIIYSTMGMMFNQAFTSFQKAVKLYEGDKEQLLSFKLYDAIVNKKEISDSLAGERGDLSKFSGIYFENKLPGKEPEIFGKNIVSTKNTFELCLNFSPDLNTLAFSTNEGILISYKKNDRWTIPSILKLPLKGMCFEPYFTPDGKYLIFNKGIELWCAERGSDSLVNFNFLTKGMFSSSTINGEIYFTNIQTGDINIGKFSNGKISNIIVPEADFNSPFGDAHPSVDPEGRFLIFDSSRPGGKGWSDYYVCFKNTDGTWSKAKNITEINSLSNDICATITPDGKYILINKDRDIYWVSSEILNKYKD